MHLSVQLLISFPVKVIAIVLQGQGNIVDHLRTVTMSNALIKAGDCKNENSPGHMNCVQLKACGLLVDFPIPVQKFGHV